MRIVSTIKDRLERNTEQRRQLKRMNAFMSRKQEIQLEFLRIEAQVFKDMLNQLQNRRWSMFRSKRLSLGLAILAMSVYVLGIFYMFKELDLSKVEQWQFAATALPLWLILTLIPVAFITFITTRKTRL